MTRFNAPIAEQIWDMKYRFKDENGKPIDITVEDTWWRIANALAEAEEKTPLSPMHSTAELKKNMAKTFYEALEDWKFLPAGRIVAGAGTGRAVTLFNCFVMGTIPDSMDGIFSMLREAALTMQQGGGIGYDFSPIRPSTSRVKKLGADASGPLSFMDCWDAMCRTVMSAGSRRGAMMATMRCDHPDIEQYIEAKREAGKLRMFNLSVLATDAFMNAVDENEDWPLVHIEPPMEGFGETPVILDRDGNDGRGNTGLPRYVHKVVSARELWNKIMKATYDAAEPGVIYIDRINQLNNLKLFETIASTNPCGEQPLPPYGACLLGSINLPKFILSAFSDIAEIDEPSLRKTVATATRMMDNVIDISNFPLEAQRAEAMAKRRIGLGVTGLADALLMLGLRYGSVEAAEMTETILKIIARESYWTSVDLAKEKGAFPLFNPENFPAEGSHVAMLCEDDPDLAEAIHKHGLRNALLTSIAPTGTISMYAGNVSSGVEPVFAYSYNRKVLRPDGSHMEERVEDYAVTAYRDMWRSGVDQNGNPNEPEEWSDDLLPDHFVTAQTLYPADHVRMQAAAQKWVDSSISKTVNLPEDISFEAFKAVYWDAYESGCKGCTTYRPNEVTGSILSVDEAEDTAELDLSKDTHFVDEAQETHDYNLSQYGDEALAHWLHVKGKYGVPVHESITAIDEQDRAAFLDLLEMDVRIAEGDEDPDLPARKKVMWEIELPGVTDEAKAELKAFSDLEGLGRREGLRDPMPLLYPGSTITPQEELTARPDELDGTTYKIKVGDQSAVYLTVNDMIETNGTLRPFEIFLRSSDPSHDEWMVAMARTISAVLRRPYDASFLAAELKQVHSHTTGGFMKGHKGHIPSLVAAIGIKLGQHMEDLKGQNEAVVVFKTGNVGKSEDLPINLGMGEAYTHTDIGKVAGLIDDDPIAELAPGKPCPKCFSTNTKSESGCLTCMDCLHSACG